MRMAYDYKGVSVINQKLRNNSNIILDYDIMQYRYMYILVDTHENINLYLILSLYKIF